MSSGFKSKEQLRAEWNALLVRARANKLKIACGVVGIVSSMIALLSILLLFAIAFSYALSSLLDFLKIIPHPLPAFDYNLATVIGPIVVILMVMYGTWKFAMFAMNFVSDGLYELIVIYAGIKSPKYKAEAKRLRDKRLRRIPEESDGVDVDAV